MADGRPYLRASDVVFSWGDRRILDGFSLDVAPGTVLCLMGVNGCGKSTFLNCVLGENVVASGSTMIDGRDAASLRARERACLVAYVPQTHEQVFPYSVAHIVLMGRTAWQTGLGNASPDDESAVDEALEVCGIAHLEDRICTTLSGGEMQMVLLARALAQTTPLIILDEPTAHLDFKNELVFLETVEQLVKRSGATILMATHAPNQAFHLAAAGLDVQVAVMDAGSVARKGTPDEVLTPETLERYFGVEAQVVETASTTLEHPMRQVVPLKTVSLHARDNDRTDKGWDAE